MRQEENKVQFALKRLLDLFVAGVGIGFGWPVILLVAIGIRLTMGRPVFFRQARPGYMGELFEVMKFRTMTEAVGPDGRLLADEQRLSGIGKIIRSFSLDELPQLFNVIKGELSIVGPRPLLVEYMDRYTPEQKRRHDVKPGITGWAQVHGRKELSISEKLELDLWYVENWSIWLDIYIMFLTVKEVFTPRRSTGEQTSLDYRELDDLGHPRGNHASGPENNSQTG